MEHLIFGKNAIPVFLNYGLSYQNSNMLLKKSVFNVIARNGSDEAISNILINTEADCFTLFAMTANRLFQQPVKVFSGGVVLVFVLHSAFPGQQ
ncbi:MAG: hypothetical protein C4560_09695 [Nitrospiraceae bacterium]|nr:MAG: hypothetical protein C4560_09695 [Nitrospiraceae bacterium]